MCQLLRKAFAHAGDTRRSSSFAGPLRKSLAHAGDTRRSSSFAGRLRALQDFSISGFTGFQYSAAARFNASRSTSGDNTLDKIGYNKNMPLRCQQQLPSGPPVLFTVPGIATWSASPCVTRTMLQNHVAELPYKAYLN